MTKTTYTEWTFRDADGTWQWCTWPTPEDVVRFLKGRDHTDAIVVHREITTTDWTSNE